MLVSVTVTVTKNIVNRNGFFTINFQIKFFYYFKKRSEFVLWQLLFIFIFLQVGKIKVTAKQGFENSEDPLLEFHIINEKWDKKG